LLEAGINDWGGISPVTKDFINPEAAWPQIARLQAETESRGFVLRERLALYPEFVRREEFLSPRVRDRVAAYPARTDLRVAPGLPPSSDSSMPSAKKLKITALAGGVGASKLLLGLYEVMDPGLLTIIVNTGDDIILHGLKISPDLDIVTYTLRESSIPQKLGDSWETFML